MSVFDICLLAILAGFVFSGLFKGIIRLAGHFIGLIVGVYVAGHFYLNVYDWSKNIFNGHDNLGKVIIFILLFVIVTRLVIFLFVLLEKLFNFIAVIPGSKYVNNLLGGVLGFLEGALFLGTILFVISRYAVIGNFFGDQLSKSIVAPALLKIVDIILPLLPAALTALKSII